MLLDSVEFKNMLAEAISNSTEEIIVFSAFIKDSALDWMFELANHTNFSIVTRWQKHDIVCGASDLLCYRKCKNLGIPFGIHLDLHGKIFCVDDFIFVGSANLTSKGLALISNHNIEFGVGFEAGTADQSKIHNFKEEILWLNDEIFEQMEMELDETDRNMPTSQQKWSVALTSSATKPVYYLWTHELIFTTPDQLLRFNLNNEDATHDFDLLGLNLDEITEEKLKQQFCKTRLYKWMEEILVENESISFGGLTAALHSALMDDPLPYRREVKGFISNLFAWAKFLEEEFEVLRPAYSEILRLKNREN